MVFISVANSANEGKHLFILSGQSNMASLDPDVSFTPAVEAAFGKDNVIVVKHALGAQPILKWYKKWRGVPPQSRRPQKHDFTIYGDIYDQLMEKVNAAIKDQTVITVTFVWMQGERDAGEKLDEFYKESLLGVVQQLRDDLKRDDINYVIGRLSAAGESESWEGVRKAQVEAAEASPRGAWVDTDDIERGGIHYTKEGYKVLGQRFAEKAIALINKEE